MPQKTYVNKYGESLKQVGGRGRFKIHILQVSSLFNFLYLIVNIITAQLSCLIVNIIIHLFYVHPSLNGYLFALLNLLHTTHHGVTCILCHFQDTLRACNHTLQSDALGLCSYCMFCYSLWAAFLSFYSLGMELLCTPLLHRDSPWVSLHW